MGFTQIQTQHSSQKPILMVDLVVLYLYTSIIQPRTVKEKEKSAQHGMKETTTTKTVIKVKKTTYKLYNL